MSDTMNDKIVATPKANPPKDSLATVSLMPVTRLVSRPSLQIVNGQLVAVRAMSR
jgi:hypothetical protein